MAKKFGTDSVCYERGSSLHIRDSEGNHWAVSHHFRSGEAYANRVHKKGMNFHSRLRAYSYWEAWIRQPTHTVMNYLTFEGERAWINGRGTTKFSPLGGGGFLITSDVKVPKRAHTVAMNAATLGELREVLSATDYARKGHGARFTRGHANIGYEWCHLIAHGFGGLDIADNIVAATKHQNTEQLIIECVLYQYREEGLAVRVSAKMAQDTKHMAESIHYEVLLRGNVIYSRKMDARRATTVNAYEVKEVAQDMRIQINKALVDHYPANTREWINYYENNRAYEEQSNEEDLYLDPDPFDNFDSFL